MSPLFRQAVLVGLTAGGLVALACHANSRGRRQHKEELLDESLDESFPASDPPASQDFDIPANRR
jgi:hypothetical protein